MIKTLVLQEAIIEKKEDFRNNANASKMLVNISSDCGIKVTIEIAADYSSEKIKEALTKIFERVYECF